MAARQAPAPTHFRQAPLAPPIRARAFQIAVSDALAGGDREQSEPVPHYGEFIGNGVQRAYLESYHDYFDFPIGSGASCKHFTHY